MRITNIVDRDFCITAIAQHLIYFAEDEPITSKAQARKIITKYLYEFGNSSLMDHESENDAHGLKAKATEIYYKFFK